MMQSATSIIAAVSDCNKVLSLFDSTSRSGTVSYPLTVTILLVLHKNHIAALSPYGHGSLQPHSHVFNHGTASVLQMPVRSQ